MNQTLANFVNFYKIVALAAKIRLIRIRVPIYLFISVTMELKS